MFRLEKCSENGTNLTEITMLPASKLQFHHGGVAEYPPGSSFGPRELRDYEFVWMIHGDARWLVDGQTVPAPAGSIFLCRPGQRDSILWDATRGSRHGYVHFAIEPRPADDDWPLIRQPGEEDVLHHLLRHVLWLRHGGPALQEQLQQALALALGCFRSGAWQEAGLQQPEVEHPVLARCFAFVQRTWRAGVLLPVSLEQLAHAGQVSANHLIRIFKQEYGATPQETLRLLRLHHASELLGRSQASVQDIAERCGFASAEHFTRRFAAIYRRSPRAHRRHVQQGGDAPVIPLVEIRRLARALV
jgi:AraC-like DNA-binding protein